MVDMIIEGIESKNNSKKATVYTEVTPKRATEILAGTLESRELPRSSPNRWFAELALDRFEPQALKEKGISRYQAVFASPVPYQGSKPIEGRVLLSLEIDTERTYVAEGDSVTEIMMQGSIKRIRAFREVFGSSRVGVTREEFEEKFNSMPEEEREALIREVREGAERYWASLVPYNVYVAQGQVYEEPEILMIQGTVVTGIKESKL
ncbi:MAG TPA: hypothetical protein VMW25_02690 [Clostridia bacterium]|nr:hypothetical protein [Clostridia bacterium]